MKTGYHKKLNFIPSNTERQQLKIKYGFQEEESYKKESSPQEKLFDSQQQQLNKNKIPKLTQQKLTNLLNRLNQNKKLKIIMRQQAKRIQQYNNICSLKNNKLKQYDPSNIPIHQKLIQQGLKLKDKIMKLQKIKQEQEMNQLKQKPTITVTGQLVSQKPINRRYKQVLTKQEENLQKLSQKYKPTFKPQINVYSKFIAEVRNENQGDYMNRLYNKRQKQQLIQNCKPTSERELEGATFKPQINVKTKQILRKNPLFAQDIPFQKRSDIMHKISKNKIKQGNQNCTFKPTICDRSQKIAKHVNIKPTVERLYQDAEIKRIKKNQKQREAAKKFSYTPKLNSNRYKLSQNFLNHNTLQQQSDQSYFSQTLSDEQQGKKYNNMMIKKPQSLRNLSTKSRYLQQSRRQSTYQTTQQKQLQKCTFKPKINDRPISRISNISQIYGFESYLKNVERARKLKFDKTEGQKKLISQKYLS